MDDTQTQAADASQGQQEANQTDANGAGTTTLDLTKSDVGSTNEASSSGSVPQNGQFDAAIQAEAVAAGSAPQTDAEKGAAIVESEQERAAAVAAATAVPIPAHTAAAATGVLSKLESEFEAEFAKGASSFRTWWTAIVGELKEHLKV